jgi:hypothetical protein
MALTGQPVLRPLRGIVTLTLDGTATTCNVNYMDGTKVISPVPQIILAHRIGGTGLATISIVSCVPTDGSKFAVQISAAGTNTQTIIMAFEVF